MALPMQAAPDLAVAVVDEWTDAEFRTNLAKVFKRLMDHREMSPEALADEMKIGRSTLYGKLKSGKFTADEVRKASRVLRVKVEAFYLPAESLLSDSIIRCYMQAAGDGPHLAGQLELHFAPRPALAVAPALTIASRTVI